VGESFLTFHSRVSSEKAAEVNTVGWPILGKLGREILPYEQIVCTQDVQEK
jgi:hypothetical protein